MTDKLGKVIVRLDPFARDEDTLKVAPYRVVTRDLTEEERIDIEVWVSQYMTSLVYKPAFFWTRRQSWFFASLIDATLFKLRWC